VGCALSGAKQYLFPQESARQKRRRFLKKMRNHPLLAGGSPKMPIFNAKLGLKSS